MSTPAYLVAHRLLPLQAATRGAALWSELSGPEWSTWLALVGVKLKVPVRGMGVEGAPLGKAVLRRGGIEMLAVYFPTPTTAGEPYYAILARREGDSRLRSFVFERGVDAPGEPTRVVMAEWVVRSETDVMRMRFDVSSDPSLEACLARTVDVMKNDGPGLGASPLAQGAPLPRLAAAPRQGLSGANVALIAAALLIALLAVLYVARF